MLGAAVAMPAGPAAANGGPLSYFTGSAAGGVAPLTVNEVELRRESLTFRLDGIGSYHVKARYELYNRGGAVTLPYGVPVKWVEGDIILDEDMKPFHASEKSIRIAVGRKVSRPCRVAKAAKARLPKVERIVGDTETKQAWCVTKVTLPAGRSVLTLTYDGNLEYVDYETSKTVLTLFGSQVLDYPLFPAGFWKGPVRTLTITLKAGVLAPFVKAKVPGASFHRKGDVLSWVLHHVDLKKLHRFEATIDAAPLERSEQLATMNANRESQPPVHITARASSSLRESGHVHGPALLFDGKLDTAWCEGVPGNGVGQWVELHIHPTYDGHWYDVEGLGIVVGYAKSRALFTANGRVRRVRVSVCGSHKAIEHRFAPLPSSPALAAQLVPLDGSLLGKKGSLRVEAGKDVCLRVEILDVAPGTKYKDTCISEIAPVLNFGMN